MTIYVVLQLTEITSIRGIKRRKEKLLLERFITAIISAIILSISLSYMNYIPVAEQQEGVGYWSYLGLFFIYIIYSLPVFLIGGIPFSKLADVIIGKIKFNTKVFQYIASIIVYGISGVIVNVFFYTSIFEEELLHFLILGIISSILFLHIMLLTRKIINSMIG